MDAAQTVERFPGCIETYSGAMIDPHQPPADFLLVDIAQSLSNQCRFRGHTARFYSVAQHSVHCCQLVKRLGGSETEQRQALFHDAAEFVFGDIPRPMKTAEMRAAEHALLDRIFDWLGLPRAFAPIVGHADDALLWAEAGVMLRTKGAAWRESIRAGVPADVLAAVGGLPWFPPLMPIAARRLFLRYSARLFPDVVAALKPEESRAQRRHADKLERHRRGG